MPKKRRSKKKRNLPLEDSSQVIYRALKQAGLSDHAQRLHIFQCWRDAVGPKIAARTTPDMFRGGVLFVKVATPTWQQELSYLKVDIIAKLNKALGKSMVNELKVICGSRTPGGVSVSKSADNKRIPRPVPHDFAVASAISTPIACPVLRAAFESLMAKDLWSKRQSHLPKAPSRH